jgi:type I restriction enzyme, S subunit
LLLRPGDLYVSLKDVTQSGDLLGAVSRVPSRIGLGRLTQDTAKLILLPGSTSSAFLYWALRTPEYRQYCRARAIGTTNLSLAREDFLAFEIPKPTHEQDAVVELLEAMEAKLELSRQINETLKGMARTLFRSWFIDFDPVRAKMAGRAQPDMAQALASVFADSFEDSELGKIPVGWRVTPLSELITLQRGTTYESRLLGQPGPVLLGLGSILPGGGFRNARLKTYGGECPQNLILYPGEIYVALKGATKDGSMVGSIARVPPDIMSGRLTQDTVKLVFKNPKSGLGQFLYWALQTPHYREYCALRATGSAQVGLSRSDFLSYRVVLPPSEVLAAFAQMDDSLSGRGHVGDAETMNLAAIRDLLLSRLLSGGLRVRDAEREVGKVA